MQTPYNQNKFSMGGLNNKIDETEDYNQEQSEMNYPSERDLKDPSTDANPNKHLNQFMRGSYIRELKFLNYNK